MLIKSVPVRSLNKSVDFSQSQEQDEVSENVIKLITLFVFSNSLLLHCYIRNMATQVYA